MEEERPTKEKRVEEVNNTRRVYVGNLSYRTSWQNLKDHFKTIGTVLYADVLTDHRGSKGCGIVEYENKEDAARAISELTDTNLDGRKIFVREDRENTSKAKPSSGGNPCQVFVGNLPYSTSWQDLKDLFRSAGNVRRADVLRDYQGRSKGCGLVLFETEEEANEAIKQYHDKEFNGRLLMVHEDKPYH